MLKSAGEILGDIPDMSDVLIDVQAVVLRITYQFEAGLTPEQLYERTRGYWVMQPMKHRDVEFALALAGDVIQEVYQIDGWTRRETAAIQPNYLRRPDPVDASLRSRYRYEFHGGPANSAIRAKFVGQPYRNRARNPVLWLNC